MVQGVGRPVIAEGVETPEQLKILRQLGCDWAQGFLIGRPMPAAVLDAWLRKHEPWEPGPA
jgi:EAL domain-containing protein (putative c-di-GMP-specific phosphodiesterase class I)